MKSIQVNNIVYLQHKVVCSCDFLSLSFYVIVDPGAVPPQANSGSVLYLSPSTIGVKLASQGFYPGTVAGIELTQRLPSSREQKGPVWEINKKEQKL